MHILSLARRVRSGRPVVILLAALGMIFLTAANPQCARTSDRSLSPTSPASADFGICVASCAQGAADARALELEEFLANKADCGEDPECHQAAAAEHVANLAAIQREFKICMAGCHDQGSGLGGN